MLLAATGRRTVLPGFRVRVEGRVRFLGTFGYASLAHASTAGYYITNDAGALYRATFRLGTNAQYCLYFL